MNLIFSLLLLAGMTSGAPAGTPQPVLMFDTSGNAFPSGSGTPLSYSPQPVECFTNASGSVLPCAFPASSTAADIVQNFQSVNVNSVGATASIPLTPVAGITVTRVEWQLTTEAATCTTTPVVTVTVSGATSAFTAPMTTVATAFNGHVDGSLNVAANGTVGLKTTTASACTTNPTTANFVVHYKMQ